jgi:hypothetical protein
MTNPRPTTLAPPARTHAEAAALFRRPFAPGAIGFRAMTRVPYNDTPSPAPTSPPTSAPSR